MNRDKLDLFIRNEVSANCTSLLHGLQHFKRVEANGLMLCEEYPQVPQKLVIWFAYLHDFKRTGDGEDKGHGERSARYVDQIRNTYLSDLSDSEIETLKKACALHNKGIKTGDLAIDVCFDADRLDLGRVGNTPNPALMCSPYGVRLAAGVTIKSHCEGDKEYFIDLGLACRNTIIYLRVEDGRWSEIAHYRAISIKEIFEKFDFLNRPSRVYVERTKYELCKKELEATGADVRLWDITAYLLMGHNDGSFRTELEYKEGVFENNLQFEDVRFRLDDFPGCYALHFSLIGVDGEIFSPFFNSKWETGKLSVRAQRGIYALRIEDFSLFGNYECKITQFLKNGIKNNMILLFLLEYQKSDVMFYNRYDKRTDYGVFDSDSMAFSFVYHEIALAKANIIKEIRFYDLSSAYEQIVTAIREHEKVCREERLRLR